MQWLKGTLLLINAKVWKYDAINTHFLDSGLWNLGLFRLWLHIRKTKIMASSPIISWQIDGETMETVTDFIFLGSKITADDDWSHEIKRCLLLGRKAKTNLDSILKSKYITLPKKVHIVKAMVFPVVMLQIWELDHREGWVLKHWCFRIVALEKTLESPLDSKEIKPVNSKGNQLWIFTGRTVAKALILGHLMQRWFIGKDCDAGED